METLLNEFNALVLETIVQVLEAIFEVIESDTGVSHALGHVCIHLNLSPHMFL